MKEFWIKSLFAITPCILSQCRPSENDRIQQERPNILIAIGDDITWMHMGAYGCDWVKTPGFDRVANDGILFRNAYTPNAKSSPSRACLLTGRNSWQLEEAANHVPFFPVKFTTFMEALSNNGYSAGYTAKGWAPGVAIDIAGNPRELTGKAYNAKKIKPPAEEFPILIMPGILRISLMQKIHQNHSVSGMVLMNPTGSTSSAQGSQLRRKALMKSIKCRISGPTTKLYAMICLIMHLRRNISIPIL